MVNVNHFVNEVDKDFWEHITKDGIFNDTIDSLDIERKDFLTEVAHNLVNSKHNFTQPICYFQPKSENSVRRIKAFALADACIYYYIVKQMQTQIVKRIKEIPHMYGGFRFTPELKLQEDVLNQMPTDSNYEGGFAKNRYKKDWSEYQKLAESLYEDEYTHFIHFDVAHFYDDINLNLLEYELQNIVSDNSDLIQLLFFFLRNIDRDDLGYLESAVGLPQEMTSEMSRMLANLYLSRFDRRFSDHLTKEGDSSDFFYTRYADDIWVAVKGRSKANKVILNASKLLLKDKLFLNDSKTKILTKDEFGKHWKFEVWDEIFEIKERKYESEKSRLNDKFKLLLKLELNKEGRWFSPSNYLIQSIIRQPLSQDLLTEKQANKIFEFILGNLRLRMKVSVDNKVFFSRILERFPDIETKVLRKVIDDVDFLYPNIQYFALSLIVTCSKRNNFDIFFNRYFKYVKLDFQWYCRCICLDGLKKYGDRLSDSQEKLNKFLKHIGYAEQHMNAIERRYTICLLVNLPRGKGDEVLSKTFNDPKDLRFIKFLKEN